MAIRAVLRFSACLSLSLLLLCTCASGGSARGEPDWVRDPYVKYDREENVAAVGMGSSRELAERSALGNLVAIFGQSIQVDETVSNSYQEAVRNGVIANWSDNTTVDSVIATSAGMDTLVGAEIRETWRDNRGENYAVAVLNKAKAIQLYSDMVMANHAMIGNLINIPSMEINSFDGYSRYQFAATLADLSLSYGNLLSVMGVQVSGLRGGNEYRIEAQNITKAIPVGIRVQNDKSGRIEGAFATVLSDVGFRSGGINSRYVLDVNVNASPVTITGNPYNWTRIEVNANLGDINSGAVLLPFNFNTREGHTSQGEADNRAYMAAEQIIKEDYAVLLANYLSSMLPKK